MRAGRLAVFPRIALRPLVAVLPAEVIIAIKAILLHNAAMAPILRSRLWAQLGNGHV